MIIIIIIYSYSLLHANKNTHIHKNEDITWGHTVLYTQNILTKNIGDTILILIWLWSIP